MEKQKFLIEKLHDNLTVTDMSILFTNVELESTWIKMQEDIVVKWHDYIIAKDYCFGKNRIDSMADNQIILYNNRAYLLCEADDLYEAVNYFWMKLNEAFKPVDSKETEK